MGYEKKSVFYDTSSNSQIDENGLSTKLIGQYDIMNQDYKKGFLVYDQKQKMFGYVDLKGKLIFEKNIEVTSSKFSGLSLIHIFSLMMSSKESCSTSSFLNRGGSSTLKSA